MAHGFSLVNCEFYIKEDLMHPLIKRCFNFLRHFENATSIQIHYKLYNIPFMIGIFRNKKNEYFINVFFNHVNITKYSLTLADLNEYTPFLDFEFDKILLAIPSTNDKFNKIDVTDSIKIVINN